MNLPQGPYNFTESEERTLKYWLANNFYKPEYDPRQGKVMTTAEMQADDREAFALICPPPNAYGRPHLGNISGYAYQDAMGRYARMRGKKVLLLPGKDHAGLEGEGVFIRDVLEKEGTDKFSLTRDEFYQRLWDFNQQNMALALKDEQTIGLSADFDRDIFTLDPRIVDTVLSTFVEMFDQKMIYKGVRIINYDPKARSAIADNQCERKEREGMIYTIKYKLADSDEFLTVATTRPETMFGDTAVAVNPTDERYAHLVGKEVIIPLTEKRIPIITDHKVEKDFGTGALKITPAHSADDYQIMNNWNNANPDKNIGYVNVIDQRLALCGPTPADFKGKKYKQALPEIIAALEAAGQLVKSEKLIQNILVSERTGAVVEPMISAQWFVDVESLKQPVIDMVKSGEVKIYPENMEAKFFHWMENLRDWAISRSLWWGYRLPVWYRGPISEQVNDAGQVVSLIEIDGDIAELDPTNTEHMRVQLQSPGTEWIQDENVLDTWFSSGQWPYATLGVYDLMDTFYPTTVMETGFDILENWVSRMMMFSYFKLKQKPFKHVYLHGLVKGTDGQKMSKSRKNIIPLDDAQAQYGIDALRMVYFYQNTAGASYALTHDKLKNFRNFNNKMWNAAKFTLSNLEDLATQELFTQLAECRNVNEFEQFIATHNIELNQDDRDLLEMVKTQEADLHSSFERFRFGNVTENLYNNFWHVLCDKYIETAKNRLWLDKQPDPASRLAAQCVIYYSLKSFMKMLHPFIPFITEEIWQYLPKSAADSTTIMYSSWGEIN
jgi:valyl-tRNA synthetase